MIWIEVSFEINVNYFVFISWDDPYSFYVRVKQKLPGRALYLFHLVVYKFRPPKNSI